MKKVIQNLKISQKLYVLVGVALIGMLMIGGMSFNLMGRLNEKTSDISTSWLPSVDTARDTPPHGRGNPELPAGQGVHSPQCSLSGEVFSKRLKKSARHGRT